MLEGLEFTSLALWVRHSWGWPLALTLHAFGAAMTVGLASIMSLCMLGVLRGLPPASLLKLIPVFWFCLGVQAISGFLLSLAVGPLAYLGDWWFDAKLVLIVIAIITTVVFQKSLRAESGSPASKSASHRILLVGAMPMVWIVVSLQASGIRYAWDYSGRSVFSYGSNWTFAVTIVVLATVFSLMYALNRKT